MYRSEDREYFRKYKEGTSTLRNKKGELTPYALACGYIEHYKEVNGDGEVVLGMDNCAYNVHGRKGDSFNRYFRTLGDARRALHLFITKNTCP